MLYKILKSEELFGQRGIIFIQNSIKTVGQAQPPRDMILIQNYPNPFNATTQIEYYLPQKSNIVFNIFSLSGKLVKELLNSTQDSGFHSITWDGRNNTGEEIGSSVYYGTIKTDNF